MVERAPYKGVTVVQLHLGGRRGTMRTDKFIRLCLKRGKNLSDIANFSWNDEPGRLLWRDRALLADLTKLIDYKCQFTTLGCKRHKITRKQKKKTLEIMERGGNMRSGESFAWGIMCCCGGCVSSLGHSRGFPNCLHHLKKIAGYFDESWGFWRLEKGCVLPRKYRSPTCLRHNCGGFRPYNSGRVLLRYLTRTDESIREHHYKRTGESYFHISQIAESLEKEMKKELKNENRTNSK